jgi:hypothetical protein
MSKVEKFWQDATADDVARVMAGETVEARFRDSEIQPWGDCYTLTGWVNELRHQWRSAEADGIWNFCQVYREPSWYAERPGPGPGYRLLEKFPDEDPQLGDSVFCPGSEIWLDLEAPFEPGQRHGLWYRRRIEPVEPVESKPLLIRRRVVEIGDEIKLPNGRVLVFNGEDFEVKQ